MTVKWERMWQEEEIGHLAEWYGKKPAAAIAKELNRSIHSVTSFARRLRLSSPHYRRWQADSLTRSNPRVNADFFESHGSEVDQVLDFIRQWGEVDLLPQHQLRIRCPHDHEAGLQAVKAKLQSLHPLRRRRTHLLLKIDSRALVEAILARLRPTLQPGETRNIRLKSEVAVGATAIRNFTD